MQVAEMHPKRFDFLSLRDFSVVPERVSAVRVVAVQMEEAPPPPPPPPSFTEKELNAAAAQAKEEGFRKGFEEGSLKAQNADAEREAQLMAIMRQCCERMTRFREGYAQHLADQREALTRLAVAVAKHVAGTSLRAAPEVPVAQMVAECLPLLLAEPRVNITVHPSIITLMKDRLEEVGRHAGYDGTLMLEADVGMAPTDCHIQWQGGSAHTSYEETWRAIEERLLQTPGTTG